MVRPHDRMALLVEAPGDSVRVIRVTGRLDATAAAGVLRMVSAQLELVTAGRSRVSDLVLDLSGVGAFEAGGLRSLRHARFDAAGRGVTVHLSGFAGRHHLLPPAAHRALLDFSIFPTADLATEALLSKPAVPMAGAG